MNNNNNQQSGESTTPGQQQGQQGDATPKQPGEPAKTETQPEQAPKQDEDKSSSPS